MCSSRRTANALQDRMPNSDRARTASALRELTETIEARQDERNQEREQKRRLEAEKRRQQLRERLVAPILLILTVLASLLLWML